MSTSANEKQWNKVLAAVGVLVDEFHDDIILIGGVAVAFRSLKARVPVEFTQDADFYATLTAWSDLRDEYDVTVNRRLAKAQIELGDVEIDLYIQRNHRLRFEFDEVAGESDVINGVRVAGLEHILLLKLDAYADRHASSHGNKDRRDIAKILVMLQKTRPKIALMATTKNDMKLLDGVMKSQVFGEVADGNAHVARKLKNQAEVYMAALKRGMR